MCWLCGVCVCNSPQNPSWRMRSWKIHLYGYRPGFGQGWLGDERRSQIGAEVVTFVEVQPDVWIQRSHFFTLPISSGRIMYRRQRTSVGVIDVCTKVACIISMNVSTTHTLSHSYNIIFLLFLNYCIHSVSSSIPIRRRAPTTHTLSRALIYFYMQCVVYILRTQVVMHVNYL